MIGINEISRFKVQHYDYSAFGKLALITDGNGNDVTQNPAIEAYYTYTGREYDKESGLYYYRARYYNASIGQFLSEDPVNGSLETPATIVSKYSYVGNNPINLVDPSGKSWGPKITIGAPRITLSKGDQKQLIQAAIIVAAAYSGGLAAELLAEGPIAGALIGGAVGGTVGGLGFEAFHVGSFKEGFIAGAVAGGIAGYEVGLTAESTSKCGRSPAGFLPTPLDVTFKFLGFPSGVKDGSVLGSPLNSNEDELLREMGYERARAANGYKEAPYQPASQRNLLPKKAKGNVCTPE